MALHLIFVAMLVAAMLAVLVPLARGRRPPRRPALRCSICTACVLPRSRAISIGGSSTGERGSGTQRGGAHALRDRGAARGRHPASATGRQADRKGDA